MKWTPLLMFAAVWFFMTSPAFGQQEYVSRYDAFAGYTFLDSPHVGLFENGFQFQAGVRPKTWYSLGFDYSISSGDLTLTPNLLTNALQQQLALQLQQLATAGLLPAGFTLSVPAHSSTQTFAAGPQLAYRHFSKITLFVRPSIGAIREVATPHPTNVIGAAIAKQLVPYGQKTEWTAFYGFGGGGDLLRDGRFTTRFSIGPCFNFGKNIVK